MRMAEGLVAAKVLEALHPGSAVGPLVPAGREAFSEQGQVCCMCLVPDPHEYGKTGLEKTRDLDHGR